MTVAVVMPAWNEAEGIAGFLRELNDDLSRFDPTFIVVDDCSADDTADVVRAVAASGVQVEVHTNDRNLGHGPSTLRALRLGLDMNPDAIVALDGDGQFVGSDVASVVEKLLTSQADVVEGVRRERNDPLYRRGVSAATRGLVWARTRQHPADANTPLRAYGPIVLSQLLAVLPPLASTPNLLISAICRRSGLRIMEIPVRSIPRRGSDQQGSTWKNRSKSLPSRRFVDFCTNATREWVSATAVPIDRDPPDTP